MEKGGGGFDTIPLIPQWLHESRLDESLDIGAWRVVGS